MAPISNLRPSEHLNLPSAANPTPTVFALDPFPGGTAGGFPLERHYTAGLAYQVSYTWSKSIDDPCTGLYAIEGCSIQHPYDIYKDRGPSAIDVTHMFSMTMIYADPFGKGKRFSTGQPVLDYIVGNWQLNNIFTARSANPIA